MRCSEGKGVTQAKRKGHPLAPANWLTPWVHATTLGAAWSVAARTSRLETLANPKRPHTMPPKRKAAEAEVEDESDDEQAGPVPDSFWAQAAAFAKSKAAEDWEEELGDDSDVG